jgi:hypothetical protein
MAETRQAKTWSRKKHYEVSAKSGTTEDFFLGKHGKHEMFTYVYCEFPTSWAKKRD